MKINLGEFFRKNKRVIMSLIFLFLGIIIFFFSPIALYRLRYFYSLNVLSPYFPAIGLSLIAIGIAPFVVDLLRLPNYDHPIRDNFDVQQEVKQALERVRSEPEKVKPAWDLARLQLQQYFDRNLEQIKYIFILSVAVMIVGFFFVLFGIWRAFSPEFISSSQGENQLVPGAITPAIVGAIAGIITEFIGATFLFIYRSTVQQASSHIRTLERINSVGMAMQILDTISNKSRQLQDETKAEIVKTMMVNIIEDYGTKPTSFQDKNENDSKNQEL